MKKISLKIRILLLALSVFLATQPLTALAMESNGSIPSSGNPITQIGFPKTALPIRLGQRFTLTPAVFPSDTDEGIVWRSSNNNIISVSQTGSVYAKKLGKATVTATGKNGKRSAKCVFTVQKSAVKVTALSVAKASLSLRVGQTGGIIAKVTPLTGVITYSSANKKVAVVSTAGIVTTKKTGSTVITVKAGAKIKKIKVSVKAAIQLKSVSFKNPVNEMTVGQSGRLQLAFSPSNATITSQTWTSGNKSVLSVSASGELHALKPGWATVTAKVNNSKTVKTTITVIPEDTTVYVTGIRLNANKAKLKIGDQLTLLANVQPENADNPGVIWTTSDAAVATADQNGVITALSAGNAVITVTTQDGGFTAACAVEVIWIPVSSVTLDGGAYELRAGESVTVHATVSPSDASEQRIVWSSDQSGVATVNENGVITAITPGETRIRATAYEGNTGAYCVITVLGEQGGGTTLSPPPALTPSPSPSPTATPAPPAYRALLVGNQYSNALTLYGPFNDLTNMGGVLSYTMNGVDHDTPFSAIDEVKDATKAQLQDAIATTFADATADDVSYFYYTGHGSRSGQTTYITMTDGGVSMSELAGWLGDIPGKVVVILDSCYSGGFITRGASAPSPELMNQDVINAFRPKQKLMARSSESSDKFYVLTACSATKESYSAYFSTPAADNSFGVFTYILTAGASGKRPADANKDDVITLCEAYNYVADRRSSGQWSILPDGNDVQVYPLDSPFALFSH